MRCRQEKIYGWVSLQVEWSIKGTARIKANIVLQSFWTGLTHWRLNEIARDPPLIPWRFFGLFQSERNHKNKPYAQ